VLIEDLCQLPGTSGNEELVRDFILNQAKPFIDEYWIDSIGNLILLKRGLSCRKKVVFWAHMDEVGFMVKHIEKNGMIRFSAVGGIEASILPAKRVLIHGKETLNGVIGIKPIHLQGSQELLQAIKKDSLYIDTGYGSSDELKKIIQLGDSITFDTPFSSHGKLWKAKAFDDRAGCAIMLETLNKNIQADFDTYYVFGVQEEVGLRGSQIAAQRIKPDLAFVFEGTTASDIPLVEAHRWTTRLGCGPAITIAHNGLVFQSSLLQTLSSLAQEHNIPFQWKEKIAGGNDATAISKAGTGCIVGSISLPVRYIHSPASLMSPIDYQSTLKLAELILRKESIFLPA
jgi:endoglucanase